MARFVGWTQDMIAACGEGFAGAMGFTDPVRYGRLLADAIGDQSTPKRISFRHREPCPPVKPDIPYCFRHRQYRAEYFHLCGACHGQVLPGDEAHTIGNRHGSWSICADCYSALSARTELRRYGERDR